jgi:hypothetical protein
MLNKLSAEEKRIIIILVMMSFFSGIFISYYVSYISAIFVKIAGVDNLPLAYIVSGLGGMLLTSIFNKFELKYSLNGITIILLPIIATSVLLVWYSCTNFGTNKLVIFFSYAWFWIVGNFILLLFWKLPGRFLSLGQNKKLNGIISSGEVVSAILAYLSIPLLLSQGIIVKESYLLLISFSGILLFWCCFMILNYKSSEYKQIIEINTEYKIENVETYTFFALLKIPLIRLLFFSVLTAVIIQSTVDFSLMIVTKEIIKDTKTLASFFGFIFGSAKVFELILKTTISNKLLKNYGVQAGIITFALVIGLTSLFGLVSHAIGAITFLFIATLLNKIMERSLVRSIYTPTLSVLFQVYTGKMQGIAQNFGDGQGKTYGQFIAGFILFLISLSATFTIKIFFINFLLIIASLFLLSIAKKLLPHYRDELKNRITKMIFNKEESTSYGFLDNAAIKNDDNRDISYVNNLFEQYSLENAKELALKQDPQKIEELINFLRININLEQINPKIKIYWLMIPEAYPYINNQLEKYKKDTIEELLKEGNIFFSPLQFERPEAKIALSALWSLYVKKLTIDTLDKSKLRPYNEDRELNSTLLSTRLKYHVNKEPKDSNYYHQLKENLKEYCQLLSISQTLEQSSLNSLKLAVKEESNQIINNIFHLLALTNDSKILNNINALINSKEQDNQVMALEILELVLDEQEKAWLLPIYQESSIIRILRKLEPFVPVPKLNLKETLSHLGFHHPGRLNLITRYYSISAFIKSKEITYNQLSSACFSKERFIYELALFHLGNLYPEQLEDILHRTKRQYPSKLNIDKDYHIVEKLILLNFPNNLKSSLWFCLDQEFNITNIPLYKMILHHYKEYSNDIMAVVNYEDKLNGYVKQNIPV